MGLLLLIIIVGVVVYVIKNGGYYADKAKNSVVSWATGQEGYCRECKHCRFDESRRFSNTDYFCALSNCHDITADTIMNCFEKPKVTEEDLQELFSLGIWNSAGKQYVRESLLGKTMTFSEVDEFLKAVPINHPEYIDPEYIAKQQQD